MAFSLSLGLNKLKRAMQKGNIRVQTENIFPIIKKFLYSDHDIFIRELVSNAVDATQKLKTLSSIGEAKGDLGDLSIDIQLDKEAKTITISDKGVGMTAEEVDKYLNQVAFSGAEEFLKKYGGQNEANIIGHFGLGFYSAFMVSERVDVITKSYKENAQAVKWECDGSPEYSLEDAEKAERGTDIVLHINEESQEFPLRRRADQ
jgi:molecular chaperone HtpG